MDDMNWLFIAPLLLLQLILVIAGLICLRNTEQTNGPKWLWAFIILFINILGPIVFFLFGRKKLR